LLDSQDDVVDFEKDTLSSKHAANFDLDLLLILEQLLGFAGKEQPLFFEILFDTVFGLVIRDLLFSFLFPKHIFSFITISAFLLGE